MFSMFQACLSLSLTKTVLPSWSFTQTVRLMDLPFSAALASFFSALSTFLSPVPPGLLAGSCASMLSEAVITNANSNVSKRFIGPPRVGFCLLQASDAATSAEEGCHSHKNKSLTQHQRGENVALMLSFFSRISARTSSPWAPPRTGSRADCRCWQNIPGDNLRR